MRQQYYIGSIVLIVILMILGSKLIPAEKSAAEKPEIKSSFFIGPPFLSMMKIPKNVSNKYIIRQCMSSEVRRSTGESIMIQLVWRLWQNCDDF